MKYLFIGLVIAVLSFFIPDQDKVNRTNHTIVPDADVIISLRVDDITTQQIYVTAVMSVDTASENVRLSGDLVKYFCKNGPTHLYLVDDESPEKKAKEDSLIITTGEKI